MLKKFILLIILLLIFSTDVVAHGGNITGWKNKDAIQITEYDGKYYGYHKENGEKHYHQVEWSEDDKRWNIVNPAVYYDENLNIVDSYNEDDVEKIEVIYHTGVDGDTAKFELNDEIITVRFLGINTPETVDKNRGEEPYGKEASNYTKEKLKNASKIEIEYDKNASKKDKYDRHLAWIWVDDNLLQEELITNGLAETYMLQNNYKYAGKLQLSEEKAKENKIGIWSGIVKNNKDTEGIVNDEKQQIYNLIYYIATLVFILILTLLGYKIKFKKR